ncbi:MAG TPA: bacillithiol biosynthesis cysteine-adding enzyme BshC [Vulgatibacter sp.]|nr:bacillithiol biosynthesis cysteine-adding enzyme BshC [Vulgatibacter sp.]
MARGLAQSYLRGEAKDLFPSHFGDAGDRRRAVEGAIRPLDPRVADELEAQNARFGQSPARARNLAALRAGAAAVVTGQQAGLFLGPLYTLYKAASAVRIARALEAETGRAVVPVFWLQTEDHDLPEIAACTIAAPDGRLVELRIPHDEGRISIAHRRLPAEVDALHDLLGDELRDLPHAEEHLSLLRRHYREGARLGDAFAGVLADLFADAGLVLVDPRTQALAEAGRPVHLRALQDARAISAALAARSERIRAAGYPLAVHVRDGAPLSFFHPDGAEGPRYRLDADLAEVGGGGRHELAELVSILDRDPLRFSTSALLRPLLQDALLPTACYVGGPGELAYLAQLPPVYELFEREMPLVAHRARFVVVEPRARRLLRRLDLDPADAALAEEVLLERCARERPTLPASLLETVEAALVEAAAPLGGEMEKALARTRNTVRVALDRFAARHAAVCLRRDEALVENVRRLRRLLHPGAPQERVLGVPHLAARWGGRAFTERVIAAAEPFDASLRELEP